MSEQLKVFVIIEFNDEFNHIFDDIIKPALEEIGYIVTRADSNLNQRNILSEIIEGITEADLIVAEITPINANVFYELGIAHALNKPVVMITQDVKSLPFDLRSYNAVEYTTEYRAVEKLKVELKRIGQEFKQGEILFGNPVWDFGRNLNREEEYEEKSNIDKESFRKSLEEASRSEGSGYLDYAAHNEFAMQQITEWANHISDDTAKLGDQIRLRTEELNKPETKASALSMRLVATMAANNLNDYANSIATKLADDNIDKFWDDWLQNSIKLLSLPEMKADNARENLANSLNTFRKLDLQNTIESLQSFQSRISVVKGVNFELTQAADRAINALEKVLQILVTGQSHINRIINVIERILEESE